MLDMSVFQTLSVNPGKNGYNKTQLKEACGEAEGLFATILLKEAMKPLLEESENGDAKSGPLLETAVEQMAQQMGRDGAFGIADYFYEQMSGQTPARFMRSKKVGG